MLPDLIRIERFVRSWRYFEDWGWVLHVNESFFVFLFDDWDAVDVQF